jgi:hypothetical protein
MASMQDEDPKIWGPIFWRVMRKIASQYPIANPSPDVRQAAEAFYESLTELLPCSTCRGHYVELIHKFPVSDNLDSAASLCNWVETIRGEVDKFAKPPKRVLTSMDIPAQNRTPPNSFIARSAPTERMRQMQARHVYYQQKIARQSSVVQPNSSGKKVLSAAPIKPISRHSIRPVTVKPAPARPVYNTPRGILTPALNRRDCGCGKK